MRSSILLALFIAATAAAQQDEPSHLGAHVRTIHGVVGPVASAFGPDGSLYVVERDADRVRIFDAASGTERALLADGEALLAPGGVAVAPDGTSYVADTGHHRVLVFGPDGVQRAAFGAWGAAPGAFHTPLGLACDGARLAVADALNDRVQVLGPDGRVLFVAGGRGGGPGQLRRPVDVAFGAGGALYVADLDNHRVVVFDRAGAFVRDFGAWGWFPSLFSGPRGVATALGRVFVADTENHRVQVFEGDGPRAYQWGKHAIEPRSGKGLLHYPAHVALDATGELAALVEPFDDRVQLFGRAPGAAPARDQLRAGVGQPSPHYGFDIAADERWMLIVEPETHTVLVHDLRIVEPVEIAQIGGYGARLGLFRRPAGLHLDGPSLTALVCDAGNRRLQEVRLRIDRDAELAQLPEVAQFVRALDFERLGRELPGGTRPWTIEPRSVTRAGERVYVLDERNLEVFVLDAAWRCVGSFGGRGAEPGRFLGPSTIVAAPDGTRIFVVDELGGCVQVFAPDGTSLGVLGADVLQRPYGLAAAADGGVFVSDVALHRVQAFDALGVPGAAWGSEGIRREELYKPRGLALDETGNLTVIDHANHRGLVQRPGGEYVIAFGARLYTHPARFPERFDPEKYVE
jgi:DNA-binding beta-propeller fold protein YncE